MKPTTINRDPFSRTETIRAKYGTLKECAWCGRFGRVFRYGTETDGGRRALNSKPFCSVDCWRSYYS